MTFSIALLTLVIVCGQCSIISFTVDNENNINGKYINPDVYFTLYITAKIDTSSENLNIEIYKDVTLWGDTKIDAYSKTITNGQNIIKLELDPNKFEESSEYYFNINSQESSARFHVSSSTCSSSFCSLCSSSGVCQCNIPHCASQTCSRSDTCSSCETDYEQNNGMCVEKSCFTFSSNQGETYYRNGAFPLKLIIYKSVFVGKIANIDVEFRCSDCSKQVQATYNLETKDRVVSGNTITASLKVPETVELSNKYYLYIKVYADGVSQYCIGDSSGDYFSIIDSSVECSDSKCTECSTSNYCTSCISGYTAKNGQCEKDEITCSDSKCTKCSSSDYCTSCISGYTAKNGQCEKNTYGDKNGCESSTDTTVINNVFINVCPSDCKSGYTKKTIYGYDYCEKSECSDSKCTECSSSDYCISCISGYTAKNGQCEKDEITCSDSKCIECSSSYYCTSCISGYTAKNGQCEKNTNDNTYGDQNGCESVAIHRTETCNSVYIDVYECSTSCKTGYTLKSVPSCANSGSYDYCEKIKCDVDHCKTCSWEDYCNECYSPYYPSNGECKEQTLQCPSNCYSCTSSNWCDECNNGYKKDGNGGCILEENSENDCQVDNCYKCVKYSYNICDKCDITYHKTNDDTCESNYICHNWCIDCYYDDSDNEHCSRCEDGYALYDDGSCMEIPETTEYEEVVCDIYRDACYSHLENDDGYYSVTPGCYNSDICSDKSIKIVNNHDSYYIVNYEERNCEGRAIISDLHCEVLNGSEKIFAILVIILIAFL